MNANPLHLFTPIPYICSLQNWNTNKRLQIAFAKGRSLHVDVATAEVLNRVQNRKSTYSNFPKIVSTWTWDNISSVVHIMNYIENKFLTLNQRQTFHCIITLYNFPYLRMHRGHGRSLRVVKAQCRSKAVARHLIRVATSARLLSRFRDCQKWTCQPWWSLFFARPGR